MKLDDLTGKKEFPSQTRNRDVWIADAIKANQDKVATILLHVINGNYSSARAILDRMDRMDKDAVMGVLTEEQVRECTTSD